MAAQIEDGTIDGLSEFCDWVIKKNLMTASAVEPLRSATKQIVNTVDEDAPESVLLTSPDFDADEYMDRFERAAGKKYTPDSLNAYRRRFKRAIALYSQFLEKGASNFSAPKGRAPRRTSNTQGTNGGSTTKNGTTSATTKTTNPDLMQYPFPLSSGEIAYLSLPPRLEKADADRMARFIMALVFEPQRQIGPGEEAS